MIGRDQRALKTLDRESHVSRNRGVMNVFPGFWLIYPLMLALNPIIQIIFHALFFQRKCFGAWILAVLIFGPITLTFMGQAHPHSIFISVVGYFISIYWEAK